jgi:hypothetical protein
LDVEIWRFPKTSLLKRWIFPVESCRLAKVRQWFGT